MMNATKSLQDIITAIRNTPCGLAFLVGSYDESELVATAQQWLDNEYRHDVREWWAAGCFDAGSALMLDDAGLSPDDVDQNCPHLEGRSWGYAHSNGDVTTDDVVSYCCRK